MFNKSNLFPKPGSESPANNPTLPRGGRLVPNAGGTQGTSGGGEGSTAGRDQAGSGTAAAPVAPMNTEIKSSRARAQAPIGENHLIVGANVKLKGAEILDCDTLVVEGWVEAKMDSRVLRIAEHGHFNGAVSVDVAEIHGRFDGEITARGQLIIHATGRVSGKIRYGRIFIEEGGEISGDIRGLESPAALPTRTEIASELNATAVGDTSSV